MRLDNMDRAIGGVDRRKKRPGQPIWPVILVTVLVGYAFYFGAWIGIFALIAGTFVLGWSRRHEAPFSTREPPE